MPVKSKASPYNQTNERMEEQKMGEEKPQKKETQKATQKINEKKIKVDPEGPGKHLRVGDLWDIANECHI